MGHFLVASHVDTWAELERNGCRGFGGRRVKITRQDSNSSGRLVVIVGWTKGVGNDGCGGCRVVEQGIPIKSEVSRY